MIFYSDNFYRNLNASTLIVFFLFQRYSRSLGRIEAVISETAHIEGSGGTTAATWMNDTGISVCSANVATTGNQNNALSNMLKRPSDLLVDGIGYEKRVKLESNHQEDHKLVPSFFPLFFINSISDLIDFNF